MLNFCEQYLLSFWAKKEAQNRSDLVQVLTTRVKGGKISFFCAVKTGHEKSPETAWFRAFSVRYLFWSHNVVAGARFELTTFGL